MTSTIVALKYRVSQILFLNPHFSSVESNSTTTFDRGARILLSIANGSSSGYVVGCSEWDCQRFTPSTYSRVTLKRSRRVVSVALSSCQFRNRRFILSEKTHQGGTGRYPLTTFVESPSIRLSGLSSHLRFSLRSKLWWAGLYNTLIKACPSEAHCGAKSEGGRGSNISARKEVYHKTKKGIIYSYTIESLEKTS
jgi:hypothetical protein